jgi:arsenate reductase
MKLYGIANCSTVKKAREWLALHQIEFEFHDFNKQGVDPKAAQRWLKQSDWTRLINRRGLTWRRLPEERKLLVQDAPSALQLMLEKSSVIKRPILEQDGKLLALGFDASEYSQIFKL